MEVRMGIVHLPDGRWHANEWHNKVDVYGTSRAAAVTRAKGAVLAALADRIERGEVKPPRRVDFLVFTHEYEEPDPGLLALLREREHSPGIPFEQVAKELFGPKWRSILHSPKRSKRTRRRAR